MENGDSPATKGDIAQLRGEMKEDIAQLRGEMKEDIAQLRAETQHQYDDLKETMRDIQTEILRAFYGYAQTTEAKLKESEAADTGLRLRLTAIEGRVFEIEKRLNMPPQQ